MLAKIRKLVYKIGIRPKPGTVLFSPSLHYMYAAREAMKSTSYYYRVMPIGEQRKEIYDEPL